MADARVAGHVWNWDTAYCSACGATRTEIDDNIITVCEPVTGPHRLAIMLLRGAARSNGGRAQSARRREQHAKDMAVAFSNLASACDGAARELRASLDLLDQASGQKIVKLAPGAFSPAPLGVDWSDKGLEWPPT